MTKKMIPNIVITNTNQNTIDNAYKKAFKLCNDKKTTDIYVILNNDTYKNVLLYNIYWNYIDEFENPVNAKNIYVSENTQLIYELGLKSKKY